ncbi:hypothetical protein Nepgr_028576 [Nepenthes gracilis]|uniref:Uncharacterized protein n=1 Tax=Nepenthes gracilis TaxID=150966 RepID=A0AAD3TAZ7_NEPGR|nr:hypothetical protein Nepgr_028576 [Nepenthes gracilis]
MAFSNTAIGSVIFGNIRKWRICYTFERRVRLILIRPQNGSRILEFGSPTFSLPFSHGYSFSPSSDALLAWPRPSSISFISLSLITSFTGRKASHLPMTNVSTMGSLAGSRSTMASSSLAIGRF